MAAILSQPEEAAIQTAAYAETESQSVLVQTALDRFLASTRLRRRDRTVAATTSAVRRLGRHFAGLALGDLSRSQIDQFLQSRKGEGVSDNTVNRDLACLRAALTLAKDDGFIERVPKIQMLRTVRPVPRVLSKNDIRKLVGYGGEYSMVFATAALAGLRAAEMRWLSWQDVDLARHQIHVRAKADWRPKSHAERSVPIPQVLVDRLRAHADSTRSSGESWVFPSPTTGGVWSESGFSKRATREARAAGVWEPGCKPLHDLRRSWASHLIAGGAPTHTVVALGGWSSIAVVERFYLSPTSEAIDAAIAASASILAT
ncbi:MAG: tyrosine-type recombinase/integrase [bacterium]|nr:tyrosine-type recombinase/integrase [bacterium]